MFHVKHQISGRDLTPEEAQKVIGLYEENEKALEEYLSRLLWWNDKINLISRNVPRETIRKHIKHSLVITVSEAFDQCDFVVDAGTGGGLPGIPLAIVRPEKKYLLNDVVSKKIMAVKQMAQKLKLSSAIDTQAHSIEEVEIAEGGIIVSKHAFKINDLWRMIKQSASKSIILLKGREEVEGELDGIEEPLRISVVDLEPGFGDSFYKGKALVEIKRKNE